MKKSELRKIMMNPNPAEWEIEDCLNWLAESVDIPEGVDEEEFILGMGEEELRALAIECSRSVVENAYDIPEEIIKELSDSITGWISDEDIERMVQRRMGA